jgi:hypothetical protein
VPAPPPVVQPLRRRAEDAFVGLRGGLHHPIRSGLLDLVHRRTQPRRVSLKLVVEVTQMGEQGVLVREERLRTHVVRPTQVTEHVVEPRGPLGDVGQGPVEAVELAVHLFRVTGRVGGRQRRQVGQQVGEHQPGQRRVVHRRRQHALDRPMRAIAGLGELIDRVPVAVLGERRGPGAVLTTVEHTPLHQRIEQPGQLKVGRVGAVRVGGVQTGQGRGHVGRVQQDVVVRPRRVEGAQHPQVRLSVVRGDVAEQAHPVVQSEDIETERCPRRLDGHRPLLPRSSRPPYDSRPARPTRDDMIGISRYGRSARNTGAGGPALPVTRVTGGAR